MNDKKLEKVTCNFCGADDYIAKYHVGEFQYVQCRKCGFVYVNPRLTEAEIKRLYSEEYFQGCGFDKSIEYKKEFEIKSKLTDLSDWDISTIKEFLRNNISSDKMPKLLDVGCGMGLFLWKAAKKNFNVEGLELSTYASDFVRSNNLKVQRADIDSAVLAENHYDTIVMKEVIEHLPDVKKSLDKIYNSLKSGGVLFLTTGNYNCPERRLKGNDWFYFMPEGHLQVFSNSTIKNFLLSAGFRKVYVTRQGDLLMNFLLKLGIIEPDKFKPKNIFKRVLFETVRAVNHFISSGMRVYAIK